LTSPMTAALGATKTVSSITGDLSNSFIIVWCLDTARERERTKTHETQSISQTWSRIFLKVCRTSISQPYNYRDNAKLLIHAHGQSTHTHTHIRVWNKQWHSQLLMRIKPQCIAP
jgi:hypothetical protein